MKDYADQQRRLLQDISNLMLRNRDLLRQREEEERQRKEKQKEAEKQINEAKNDESEAQPEVEVPEAVARDDVVPQLNVPKDMPKDTVEKKNEEANGKGVKEVQEQEIKPESEVSIENVKPDVEKMETGENDDKSEENVAEKSADIDKDNTESLLGAARKGEQFHLDLPLTSNITTLESPAFIPASALPVVVPPSEEEVAREAAEQNASLQAASPEYNPLTFPPSPMVGTAKPITTLSPDIHSLQSAKSITQLSPNARRKFVISRVQESASPVTKSNPPAKHSTETVSASGDSSSQQPSSFQSPDNGNHGNSSNTPQVLKDSQSGDDQTCKEPASLTDNSTENKDLNENPTERVSVATDSVITDTASQQAEETSSVDDTNTSSKTDNCAKSVTIKSNESSSRENTTLDENTITPTDNSDSNDTNHNMTIEEVQKLPDFHTNLSLNGMKVELANVIDSLDKSAKSCTRPQGSQEVPISQGDSGMI